MKLKNVSFLGALLMAVAGGCAHTSPTATASAYRPVSNGQPVDVSSYDLNVGGQAGGRVVFMPAKYVHRRPGNDLIVVPVRIDNNSDREFRMQTAQLSLTTGQAAQLPLIEVDGAAVPDVITVAPGQSRTFQAAFVQPLAQSRHRGQLLVSWALYIDGAQPITRVTPFLPQVAEVARGNGTAAELPAMPNPRAMSTDSQPYYEGPIIETQHTFGQLHRARAFTTKAE